MSTIIQAIEAEQLKSDIPNYTTGDTVVVWVKIKEGSRERLQAFEGVVIAISNRNVHSAVTVRKISHGEGVERVFLVHSPLIDRIEIKRRGKSRKAKLYRLREVSGRAARIEEDLRQAKLDKLAAQAQSN